MKESTFHSFSKALRRCLILIILGSCLSLSAKANEPAPVLFFYSKTCAQCHQMMNALDEIKDTNEGIGISYHEVDEEAELWEKTCEYYGIPAWGVPRLFIDDKVFAGWFEYQGDLRYADSYNGYLGYKNQILLALETHFNRTFTLNPVIAEIVAADEECGC